MQVLLKKNISLRHLRTAILIGVIIYAGAKTLPTAAATTVSSTVPAPFTFTYKDQKFPINQTDADSWQGQQTVTSSQIFNLAPPSFQQSLGGMLGQNATYEPSSQTVHYRVDLIYNYILKLSDQINTKTVEPVLKIENNRAVQFVPPTNGLKVDVFASTFGTLNALEQGQSSFELVVNQNSPQTQMSQTNSLGINELVAEGVSNFKGSPKNRRHNIAVGVEKFQGIIIPQGAEFSFDDNLGPVEAAEGFVPELVIKGSEGTIPELGGGLCQVSTTTFRAAMQAGLPITDRRNHAYAVQYYSPQGTDATIYPGSADLKFINNTPGAILIWPYEKDSNTLIFDFYGTKDGRQVTLEKPVVYDRKSDGSMKATWTRIVVNNGETSTSTFKSIYQSPALFHKTEAFISATGTQASGLKMPAAH